MTTYEATIAVRGLSRLTYAGLQEERTRMLDYVRAAGAINVAGVGRDPMTMYCRFNVEDLWDLHESIDAICLAISAKGFECSITKPKEERSELPTV